MTRLDRFVALTVALGFGLVAVPLGAQNFIGGQKCGSCHAFELEIWTKGPHARAHRALTPEQLRDPKCSTCHTMASDMLEAQYLGVQCERCHGGGRYYRHDYVMKDQELARAVGLIDVDGVSCQQCHTTGTPSIEPFVFGSMWAEIDHGEQARRKWEEAKGVEASR